MKLGAVGFLLALALCSSCSRTEDPLCSKDDFFCKNDWETQVDSLSAQRSYELDQIFASERGEGNRLFEDHFAKSGVAGLEAIIMSQENSKYFDYNIFVSNVIALRSEEADPCGDEYLDRLISYLQNMSKYSSAVSAEQMIREFRSYCIGDFAGTAATG